MPANDTADVNEGVFVYTLAFQITGTTGAATGTPVSNVYLTMDLSADDQYSVYVNPAGDTSGTKVPSATDTPVTQRGDAWTQIGTSTLPTNAGFVVGTNYLVIVVDNTNSETGNNSSTTTNASGFYQIGLLDRPGGGIDGGQHCARLGLLICPGQREAIDEGHGG
jgi:hypothetical protein